MNRAPSRPTGLDEIDALTKPKLAFRKAKTGVSNIIAEQADALNQLTHAYEELRLRQDRHEEELQLNETDQLQVHPIAKYMYAGDVEISSNVLIIESGQEVEFATTGILIETYVQENVIIRLSPGKKVTAVEVEFPAAQDYNAQTHFIINPSAPIVAVGLAILNLLFDEPIRLPRRVLPMSRATRAMINGPPPPRLLGAPRQRQKTLPLPAELEVHSDDD